MLINLVDLFNNLGLSLGVIRIIKVPAGEAPVAIRELWVGVEIPCLWRDEDGGGFGVMSRTEKPTRAVFGVPQDQALDALAKVAPEAVRWWNANGFPIRDELFNFGVEEAEVIKPVLRKSDVFPFLATESPSSN